MFYRTHLMLHQEWADLAERRAGCTRDVFFRALDEHFTFTNEIARSFAAQ